MSTDGFITPLVEGFRGDNRKPLIILAYSSVALVGWKYFCSPAFYLEHLASCGFMPTEPRAAGAIYSFVCCFLLIGIVPAVIVKAVFREKLADYGLQLGDRARTTRTFLVMGPLFALGGYLAAGNTAVAEYYPINPKAGQMFGLHAFTYLLFYMGWEFYFRGFMQFGLRRRFGDAGAIMCQVLASTLLHIGTPAIETFGAVLGGVIWGLVAFRTRSLLSGFLQHSLLGITLDWALCHLNQ
ncbi:MAG: CPBP family intramembrane glutamic endopeptidase [Planctomycetota bacterium]|nr:CPBP family intramembrane glutamic endopeptidase [Planctomycetota bacterium]